MRRELHVRFCEGGGVQLPSATRPLPISSYCAQREVELRALCDPRVKDALSAAGIRCIAYGELSAVPETCR